MTRFGQRAWRTEWGLPPEFVQALLQTCDGHLWIGAQEHATLISAEIAVRSQPG